MGDIFWDLGWYHLAQRGSRIGGVFVNDVALWGVCKLFDEVVVREGIRNGTIALVQPGELIVGTGRGRHINGVEEGFALLRRWKEAVLRIVLLVSMMFMLFGYEHGLYNPFFGRGEINYSLLLLDGAGNFVDGVFFSPFIRGTRPGSDPFIDGTFTFTSHDCSGPSCEDGWREKGVREQLLAVWGNELGTWGCMYPS